MYKIFTHYLHKFLLVMKLTTLIILAALLQVSAATRAQQLTFVHKQASLEQLIREIRRQTGYNVLAATDNIRNVPAQDVSFRNTPLQKVLDIILQGQPLAYEIRDKTILIKEKQPSAAGRIGSALAIPITISGEVADTTGAPLPGATITNITQNKRALTNENGIFLINAQAGDQFTVSFIGYLTYTFTAREQQPYQRIILHSSNSRLEEVVVVNTGYQAIPQERATGSFAQPVKEMYNERVATDVLSKLAGITSGLIFNSNTPAASTGSDINIRGRSTIFANDQPLVVVDNFPYNGDIKNINPNDVESVTVLKDAAAASIWGVRAGNGVIVITTKKGRIAHPMKIGFNASLSLFDKPDLSYNPNQLDAASYIDLEAFLFKQGYYDANLSDATNYPVISPAVELLAAERGGTISGNSLNTQLDGLRKLNINDQLKKNLYQNAADQQYGLNFSGGSDKTSYYFSGGYDHNLPSAKENSYQRITINSQNTFKPVAGLEVTMGLNLVQSKNRIDNTLSNTVNHVFPYSQIADATGRPLPISYGYRDSYIQAAPGNGFLDWSYSPLKDLGAADNRTVNNDIRLTGGLKYTFIAGLSAELKYQYERANIQNRNFEGPGTYLTRNLINQFSILSGGKVTGYNIPLGGILGLSNANTVSNNLRAQLNYTKSWKNNVIAAIAGVEFSQVSSDNNGSSFYGYNNDNTTFANINTTAFYTINPSGNTSTINSGLNIGGALERIRSSFANIAYTYRDKYTLSGSARIDGSNYFGVATNQKSLPLWSAGGKWDIYKENFYTLGWLPLISVRATYGYNGNLDRSVTGITTLLYQSNALYTNLPYSTISNIGNPDLTWEKTGIANFAMDFSSKNNILSGSFEYFFKKETDVLGFKNFPRNAGIISLEGNYSDMSGQGFDLSLTSRNLTGRLKWSTTLLFSHATDKVTRYDVIPQASQLVGADGNGTVAVPNLGKPVFGVYSYKWGGLNPLTGNPEGYVNGVKSEDYDAIINNPAINDLAYSGPARPTYFGGLNNRFVYKGFSLDIQINYKLGYYFRKPTIVYSQASGGTAYLKVNRDYNNRWQKAGDEKTTNVPSIIYPFSGSRDEFYQGSEIAVEKGDHIRLQDISLSYDFSRTKFAALPFSDLQIFIYGNNLGILWKANHSGLDPDAVPGGNDRSTVPAPRSIAFGIKGTF